MKQVKRLFYFFILASVSSCIKSHSVVYENNPNDFAPSYNADGSRLLYYTYRNGPPHIYYYDVEIGKEIQVTNDEVYWDFSPTWTPDGNQILFQSDRNGGMGIYIVDITGENLRPIVSDSLWNATPSMSSDGKKIAYASRVSKNEKFQLCILDLETDQVVQLGKSDGHSIRPEWSPDGSRIYFHSDRHGSDDIFAIDSDGTDLVRLTNGKGNENTPRISRDGKQILYAINFSSPENNYQQKTSEIHIMNADGSNQRQLTENSFDEFFPNWAPDNNQIVFSSDHKKLEQHYFRIYKTSLENWNPQSVFSSEK